ncbi:MerR family transcriptional regulator [Knoellia subterranea KCTC 19937]|uniref:MerR family transcriptional regulator n=1 Tax=Knoellia subterranea KCTC 19937 TaxID=1385521 RepID=A0A0A0JNH6_9MICO|nr:MerR family transcriptional regulator [Knoellia subterranea KCTC 19937]
MGEFALHGRVSVRMLRHYDALGLLVPAAVDPHSGYRSYTADQLSRLNRLVALKDLGFALSEIGPILDADVGPDELRAMLVLRRSQVSARIEEDRTRLAEIERRLRTIEKEHDMSDLQFTTKPLPELTLAQRAAAVTDRADIGPVIGPMFGALLADAGRAGLDTEQPTVAWYDGDEDEIRFAAGMPLRENESIPGYDVETLPTVERAVTVVHRGSMETIGDTWQALMQYIGAAGLSPSGRCREVYISTPLDDEDAWVTELQQPVA